MCDQQHDSVEEEVDYYEKESNLKEKHQCPHVLEFASGALVETANGIRMLVVRKTWVDVSNVGPSSEQTEEMWVFVAYKREDGAKLLVETCRRKRR